MQISAKELRQMASDVDDIHHEAMRTFKEEASELHLRAARGSRRSFVKQAGLAGVGGSLLTLGGGLAPFTGFGGLAAAQDAALSDTVIAGYAQSVELAAVAAYTAAAPALKGDVLAVAQLFLGHHQDHADAFGAVAGDDARPEPNAKLVAAVTPTLDAVGAGVAEGKDMTGDVLQFAKSVENQAAYTYAAALTLLTDPAYAAATSTILPIEAQHATVIALTLGEGADEWFPTGAFESAALGDGTDPKAGFDPAVFA
ncbi:MAG: ferritin-like domain-containing protein, partial [Acidimicrobiales bacterium]